MNWKRKHNNRKTVDFDMLFRSFNNVATDKEESLICDWLAGNEENKKTYAKVRDLHEAFIMEAPIELLEGRLPGAARKRRRMLHTVLKGVGYAAALAIFCIAGYGIINSRIEARLSKTMNTIEVPAGKSMDYILADGTLIKLNSGARLQYPMAFAKDRREVQLEGEAYFDVAHNDRQPFVVNTFACKIEVLGTTFSVNADEEAGKFSAVLAEGSVKLSDVSDPDKTIVMEPDQKVSFSNGRFILYDRPAELEMRWTEGIIDIGGLPFDELMKKLEKSFGVEIVIDRDTLPAIGFTDGRIRISDGIEDALRILQQGADFTWSKDYSTGVITIR